MSLTDITVRVAIVCGLALAALFALGWRSAPRWRAGAPRAVGARAVESSSTPFDLAQQARRKFLGLSALGGIAVVAGVLVALVVSVAVSWVVTNFLDRL